MAKCEQLSSVCVRKKKKKFNQSRDCQLIKKGRVLTVTNYHKYTQSEYVCGKSCIY